MENVRCMANLHVNSNMWGCKLTQNLPMNTMAMVFCSYDAPNSNLSFSLQNEHAWANDYMIKFHAMQYWIWKI